MASSFQMLIPPKADDKTSNSQNNPTAKIRNRTLNTTSKLKSERSEAKRIRTAAGVPAAFVNLDMRMIMLFALLLLEAVDGLHQPRQLYQQPMQLFGKKKNGGNKRGGGGGLGPIIVEIEDFEADSWKLTDCGKYFFVRNGTTLVAFTIGGKFETDLGGFTILGAHSDSPCLKISHGT